MELLADAIGAYGSTAGELDKPVVDKTVLNGTYDFTLQLAGRLFSGGPPPGSTNSDSPPPDLQGTSFLSAVREQLGLKLVPAKGTIKTLVIDHVERPSEN
jgi:bla regulator protein BlaR1